MVYATRLTSIHERGTIIGTKHFTNPRLALQIMEEALLGDRDLDLNNQTLAEKIEELRAASKGRLDPRFIGSLFVRVS